MIRKFLSRESAHSYPDEHKIHLVVDKFLKDFNDLAMSIVAWANLLLCCEVFWIENS